RHVKLVQLRDILNDLGVRGTRHIIDGPDEVVVARKSAVNNDSVRQQSSGWQSSIQQVSAQQPTVTTNKTNAIRNRSISNREERQLETELVDALKTYLNNCVNRNLETPTIYNWIINVKLSQVQIRTLATSGEIVNIYGGRNPIVGTQEFEIEMSGIDSDTKSNVVIKVSAQVSLAADAVIVRRNIAKGEVITNADLTTMPCDTSDLPASEYFTDASLVAGKAASKPIRAKSIVSSSMLQSAIMVRKGENVIVHATSPGIVIKTAGKAKESGAMGDLILIERLDKEKATFQAIVDGFGRVTVNATSTIVR
ncbi:MAG: flagellar basal body P-ring formation chaperone FlgA, partial [Planctomycetaceae bacterium]|nr:flagellar basal body P-ring formation chaperone FlgA [Planctomycetaceae bacterium]